MWREARFSWHTNQRVPQETTFVPQDNLVRCTALVAHKSTLMQQATIFVPPDNFVSRNELLVWYTNQPLCHRTHLYAPTHFTLGSLSFSLWTNIPAWGPSVGRPAPYPSGRLRNGLVMSRIILPWICSRPQTNITKHRFNR